MDNPSTPGASKNVLTTTTAKLVGDDDSGAVEVNIGSRWNFTTELFVELAADAAPTSATGRAGGPGTDVDFFGRPRAAAGALEAGPFQNVSGKTMRYQLWPPGGEAVAPPPPRPPRNAALPHDVPSAPGLGYDVDLATPERIEVTLQTEPSKM